MDRVHAAVEAGRCVVALGAHLLQDPNVLLALRDRGEGLPAIALSGPAVASTYAPSADGLARAIGQTDGVLVVVEPESKDQSGLEKVAKLVQASSHKPTVVVVSRSPNPLLFSMLFRGLPLQMEKDKGPSYLKKLPKPSAESLAAAPSKADLKAAAAGQSSGKKAGVKRQFLGREEEVEALGALLGEGGPIVVHGPEGVGRNMLLDEVIGASSLKRLPDVILGRGTGFDSFIARLAHLTASAGANQLKDALSDTSTSPLAIVDAAIEALGAAESLAESVMVVQPLEAGIGRQLDFFRKDRLATLIQALLGNRYSLRLVFVAEGKPQAFDHEENQAARLFEVKGIKGRFFHEIFEAHRAPEFEREKFGPMADKIFGHPMVARQYAVEVRERDKGVDLVDDPKFMKMADPGDTGALRRALRQRLDGLDKKARAALARVAHVRLPLEGSVLADMGMARNTRLELMSAGLLEACGTDDNRLYRVHPLVKSCFKMREIADFDVLMNLAPMYARWSNKAEGLEKLVYAQEANRCFVGARRGRDTLKMDLPDNDADIEAITGMIRSKNPRFDMAQQRLGFLLKTYPANADAHLLNLELLRRLDAKKDAVEAAYETAMTQAPVAEVFQDACTFYLTRRSRPKAIEVLERATQALPNEARLKTRLASLLFRQGRRNDALELLNRAMEQAPMLPDAYGLMGMARMDEGAEAMPRAEELLREAVRLAPNDQVQIPRLVHLLLAKADAAEGLQREEILSEARELLARITRDDSKHADGFLLLARVEREGGNLDRADWLLKQARKHAGKRARIGNRLRYEWALVALARGDLDKAEKDMRDLIEKDPANAEYFASLSSVLEAREQLIPAHAELLRAQERVPANSVRGQQIVAQLQALQARIEAQAAAVAEGGVPSPLEQVEVAIKPPKAVDHVRTVRRRPAAESGAEQADASSPDVGDVPEALEAAAGAESAGEE